MATLQQNPRDLGGGVAKSDMDLQAGLASKCLGFRVQSLGPSRNAGAYSVPIGSWGIRGYIIGLFTKLSRDSKGTA